MQIVWEGEMGYNRQFFHNNDKDDRFTLANSVLLDFPHYPNY
ncbi:MAG TPA: hypothetical protein VKA40_00840 [Nitrososphaera sp.]|nr:hypothetical protein [Nitrososphaera sp.]